MRTVTSVVVGLAVGYVCGAALGYVATQVFSGNVHDKELEAVMTSAFATGPLGAALGVAAALFFARRR